MYGAILLAGLALFVAGGAVGGEWGGYMAVGAFFGTPVAALVYLYFRPDFVKDPKAKLAAIEAADEEEEPPSRWERVRRLTPQAWRPASEEQRAEVRRLAKQHRGALVRSRPDGAAEVQVHAKGSFVRYSVSAHGDSRVVDRSPVNRLPKRIAIGSIAFFLLAWVTAWALDGTGGETAARVVFFAAFVIAGLALMAWLGESSRSGALLRTKRGERWAELGFPKD